MAAFFGETNRKKNCMSNPFSQPYGNVQSRPELSSPMPPSETNGLGIAGFIVSLIGILTCGILSIIGLGLSLVALRKNPKVFAIIGVVLGVIGLLELAIMAVATYNTMQAVRSVQAAMTEGFSRSSAQEYANDIAEQWKLSEQLPSQEEGQKLIEGEADIYGNEFRYETDGSSFSIRAAGEDQSFDTEDDIVVGPFSEAQEAIDLWEEEGGNFDFEMDDELEVDFDVQGGVEVE